MRSGASTRRLRTYPQVLSDFEAQTTGIHSNANHLKDDWRAQRQRWNLSVHGDSARAGTIRSNNCFRDMKRVASRTTHRAICSVLLLR